MDVLFPIQSTQWDATFSERVQGQALEALEQGRVLFWPKLSFLVSESERQLLSPETVYRAKNVSYNPSTGEVGGTRLTGSELGQLRELLDRFGRATRHLLDQLLPAYRAGLRQGRTSLRPVEIAGRSTSWRKDDTRLHVDSFPSLPTQGNRILRVFSNINPEGKPRVWRVGESFDAVVQRFWPALRKPMLGSSLVRYLLRMTRLPRSVYDSYMLQLHDRMKESQQFQEGARQARLSFPAGSTWLVFTDQVPHAAMSGIHQLEQTYEVPVSSLRNIGQAPLRVLERLAGHHLA
jgi:hypothetical protein